MSLANLFSSPRFGEQQDVWAFSNQDHHRQLIEAIRVQVGIELQVRQLDPMPADENLEFWLQKHQQVHNDFTSVLNIEGADLTELDFKNPRELDAWTFLHANEHRLAAQILGI